MQRSRLVTLLVATAAGVVFLAGLLTSGALAAVLLIAVAAFLVLLSAATWPSVPARGRRVRVIVVVVVLAIAVVKLATASSGQ
jgi:hypothetical protein